MMHLPGKTALFGLVVWMLSGRAAQACSVCYGAAESSVIDGARLSIIFMLVITYLIIAGFVAFFVYLRRREKLFTQGESDWRVEKGRGV